MFSKLSILLLCILGLAVSGPIYTRRDFITGDGSNWLDYRGLGTAIYQNINFSSLGLTKTPAVSTFLTCTSGGWAVTGVNAIYNLSPTGFTVYLRFPTADSGPLTLALASQYQFVLNYVIYPK
jgi:hypothetical protein